MRTALFLLLIALVPLVLGMIVLREFLFIALVVPTVQKRGLRFWLNSLLGGTKKQHTQTYLQTLPDEQRQLWQNKFIANANVLIGAVVILWFVILLLVR